MAGGHSAELVVLFLDFFLDPTGPKSDHHMAGQPVVGVRATKLSTSSLLFRRGRKVERRRSTGVAGIAPVKLHTEYLERPPP